MICNVSTNDISKLRTVKLTTSQIKAITGAKKAESLFGPGRGCLVWLQNHSSPLLPIEIPRQFYLDRDNRPLRPLRWIHDRRMIGRFRIPFRGYADFVYGNFIPYSQYGQFFQLASPLEAKHLLIRVRWSEQTQLSQQYAFTPLSCQTQYYAVKEPDAQGIGYDFLVMPVAHQENYDHCTPDQHRRFIASCRARHAHDYRTYITVEQRLAAEQQAALLEDPGDPDACRTQLEEMQRRIWVLYCDGYKKLPQFGHITFDDERGCAEFMGHNVPYTKAAVRNLESSISRYETDAERRAAVLRQCYALRTQFEQRGQNLELDVPTKTPDHPTLALRFDGRYFLYSEDMVAKLKAQLETNS